MDWIEAKFSNNNINKHLLFCLVNIFNFKLPKEYLETINDIVKNSKIYIFEKNIYKIENKTFEYCEELINVDIPDSVINIEEYSFSFCDSLTSIIIPDSVTRPEVRQVQGLVSIGYNSFSYCTMLSKVLILNKSKDLPDQGSNKSKDLLA